MKTLRQVLGEYTEEQLGQVAQWWGIGGTPDEGWRHHPGLLAQSMQDHIAARFAWEQLLEDERKVLHNALNFAASTGILHDVLLKISRLPETSFEKALFTLTQRLLLVEEKIALKTGRAVTSSSSSKQKKPQLETTSRLFIPRELLDPLLIIGREIYTPQNDRSEMKLESILSLLSMDKITRLAASMASC